MVETVCNYGSILLAMLSIAATAYFARKYSEKKLPKFAVLTERKISKSEDTPGNICVSYNGQVVDRVTSTLVWFWNAGRRPIRREDIPSTQPLEIRLVDDGDTLEILDTAVRKVSRKPIGFTIEKCGAQAVSVLFDFLDEGDGAAIEILHTGSSDTDAHFSGVILGSPRGILKVTGLGISQAFMPLHRMSRTARRLPLAFRITFSVVITILFGGLAWIMLALSQDITTSAELLKTHLKQFLKDQSLLDPAVSAVLANAKYRTANKVMPYIMAALFLANLAYGYLMVWKRPFPFPSSLAIGGADPDQESEKNDGTDAAEQRVGNVSSA